ncbi:MAG: GGDEF domain-containing protein [Treponema sp.]|nr:GGDEF domain-containing protein [Treponema sp.]
MSKESNIKKRKFAPKMKVWVIVTPVLAVFFGLLVIVSDVEIQKTYRKLNEVMFDYSECNQAISNFREASEFLTNQIRFYVSIHNPVYMSSFMYEVDDLNRRETAVRIVEMTHKDDAVGENLNRAFKESERLKKTELYAMKLVCDAVNMNAKSMPLQMLNINLTEADKQLSAAEKIKKAQDIVYDYEYLSYKNTILRYSAGAHNSLVEYFMDVQKESDRKINRLFITQFVLVILVLVTFSIFCLFIILYVLIPIRKNVQCIVQGKRMSHSGADEVLTIAKAYNTLCDKNAVTASVLKHKAEHDSLTGLINREAFENIKQAYTGIDEPLAYLMIDVDLFKTINDKYGHMAGDDVLRKVSELLLDQFRNTDYVGRIGGDEFAIIMTKLGDNPEEIIARKIRHINETLIQMVDGLPPVSLSVGAAISDYGYSDELIRKADEALYKVKENGRCNCEIMEVYLKPSEE